MKEKDRLEVLHEDMNAKFEAVMEYVQEIPEIKSDVKVLKVDVAELKSDMKIVKLTLKDHSADIKELKAKAHTH